MILHLPSSLSLSLSPWDIVLVLIVTTMGTALAYVTDPKWKAFFLGLPFPFTIANLSLNQPVGPSHVLGLVVLLLFTNLVRWLHNLLKLPIIIAIAISACVYLALGAGLNRLVPRTALAFWISLVLTLALGVSLLTLMPRRNESSYRSPLQPGLKIAAIAGVTSLIVALKQILGGFMTMFPMVGTIAAYEARHSLWTVSRQIPIFILGAIPMMAVMWLTQNLLHVGIPLSLAEGWIAFLAVMAPVTIVQMRPSRSDS